MKNKSSMKECAPSQVVKNAIRNYETYVEHYKSRNLIPMPLNDFLNNYKN